MIEGTPLTLRCQEQTICVTHGPNDSFWQLVSDGAWEPDTFAVFRRFIDREHSYVDIGSWVGPTLLYGSKLAKHAYGVEPDPIAFKELKQNLALNAGLSENVNIFNLCIAEASGEVRFGNRAEGGDSTSSLLFSSGKTTWTVKATSFCEFVNQNRIHDCNFIKMDIEGGEFRVLPSMISYLREHRPTFFLSLHPCFIYPTVFEDLRNPSIVRRAIRVAISFWATVKILRLLRFYRFRYDSAGRSLSLYRMIRICRGTLSIVVTDTEWAH
jgi:FkbM family methyltransferase